VVPDSFLLFFNNRVCVVRSDELWLCGSCDNDCVVRSPTLRPIEGSIPPPDVEDLCNNQRSFGSGHPMKPIDNYERRVLSRLGEVWPSPRICPAFKADTGWQIAISLLECREYQGDSSTFSRASLSPFVAAVCPRCGNTLFFNAIKLGIIDAASGDFVGDWG